MTDQTARPLPTFDEIRACGHTPTQHRTIDGLEADLRTTTRAAGDMAGDLSHAWDALVRAGVTPTGGLGEGVDQLAAERDQARATIAAVEREHGETLEQLTQAWAALNAAGTTGPGSVAQHIAQLAEQRDVARHLVELRTAALGRRTGDLTAAVRVVDAVRAGVELIDRAMAAYDAPGDLAGPVDARRQTAAERPDSPAGHPRGDDAATEAHRGAQLLDALDAWAQHWHRYIAAGAHPAQPADIALLAAYNAHRPDADAEGDEPCADPVCPTLLPEQSCDTCGRYVDWPRLAATPTPGSGGDHAQGQAEALAPWIRRAVGDPGSIAGDRRGPSWPEGSEGWAQEQETVAAWTTRAVLRVIAHGGRPVCERCDEVIRVDDAYDPPLPGIGLWEHRGQCPGEPTPAEIAEHRATVGRILADVRAGRPATTREG